jgi:hypothetical protein
MPCPANLRLLPAAYLAANSTTYSYSDAYKCYLEVLLSPETVDTEMLSLD